MTRSADLIGIGSYEQIKEGRGVRETQLHCAGVSALVSLHLERNPHNTNQELEVALGNFSIGKLEDFPQSRAEETLESLVSSLQNLLLAPSNCPRATRELERLMRLVLDQTETLRKFVIDRLNRHDRATLSRDDLEAAACIGTLDAIRRFDPAKGNKFVTYLVHRMRGEIIDTIRTHNSTSGLSRCYLKHREQVLKALDIVQGTSRTTPTTSEVVAYLRAQELRRFGIQCELDLTAEQKTAMGWINTDTIMQILKGGPKFLSWRTDTEEIEHEGFNLEECISAGESSVIEDLEREDKIALYWRCLSRLTAIERHVMLRYYDQGGPGDEEPVTLKVIGKELGVSESGASRIHARALRRLRMYVRNDGSESLTVRRSMCEPGPELTVSYGPQEAPIEVDLCTNTLPRLVY